MVSKTELMVLMADMRGSQEELQEEIYKDLRSRTLEALRKTFGKTLEGLRKEPRRRWSGSIRYVLLKGLVHISTSGGGLVHSPSGRADVQMSLTVKPFRYSPVVY